MSTNTDYTRRASSINMGDRVNDSQTSEQIIVAHVERDIDHVIIVGRLNGSQRAVTRTFDRQDRVTITTPVLTTPVDRVLVHVEIAQRVAKSVDTTLGNFDSRDRMQVEQARAYCREALDLLDSRLSDIACTFVKDQAKSDAISQAAQPVVAEIGGQAAVVMGSVRL